MSTEGGLDIQGDPTKGGQLDTTYNAPEVKVRKKGPGDAEAIAEDLLAFLDYVQNLTNCSYLAMRRFSLFAFNQASQTFQQKLFSKTDLSKLLGFVVFDKLTGKVYLPKDLIDDQGKAAAESYLSDRFGPPVEIVALPTQEWNTMTEMLQDDVDKAKDDYEHDTAQFDEPMPPDYDNAKDTEEAIEEKKKKIKAHADALSLEALAKALAMLDLFDKTEAAVEKIREKARDRKLEEKERIADAKDLDKELRKEEVRIAEYSSDEMLFKHLLEQEAKSIALVLAKKSS